jgi:hypothetical protein
MCRAGTRPRPGRSGCPSVWYRATFIHKTAFGAAKVVEPAGARRRSQNQAHPRALPSQLRTHRDAGRSGSSWVCRLPATTSRPPVFLGRLQRRRTYGITGCDVMTVRSHIGRRFDIDVLRP